MKKVLAFGLASALFLGIVSFQISHFDDSMSEVLPRLYYNNGLEKFNCPQAVAAALNKDTILFLGSSELSPRDEKSHPQNLFHDGNSDFNLLLFGAGYNQSLSHAIHAGALADDIANKKVVLNLSPQWFTEKHLSPEAFSSRFYLPMYEKFIKNPDITEETKQKVSDRCKALLTSYPGGLAEVEAAEKVYLRKEGNRIDQFELSVGGWFSDFRGKYQLLKQLQPVDFAEEDRVIAEEIDFDAALKEAQKQGEADCTNNDFYIYNEYYDSYIAKDFEKLKNSSQQSSYCTSPEYGDLKLFLDVCKETGLNVLLVNIPVQGFWYDYTGFPQKDRQQYYQNIRQIADEYGVSLLDLSEHEYTPYFFRDTMHLGWKGWGYVNQGVYEFYKKD